MTLLNDIQEYFGTQDLYEVLATDKGASEQQIKKAYRKASLKVHPDRVDECEKSRATKKFQVLAQVHYVLSDGERRKLYDDQGIIANDDGLDGEADWDSYWRLLFPKLTEKDIMAFMDNYVGSEEEEHDLISIYNRFKGDLDKISETHISFDEVRTIDELKRLIEEGKIENFPKFSRESDSKKDKRKKRAQREAQQAEKMKEELRQKTGKSLDTMDDLSAMIKSRQQGNFNTLMSSLEAKYSGNSRRGVKRKRD